MEQNRGKIPSKKGVCKLKKWDSRNRLSIRKSEC